MASTVPPAPFCVSYHANSRSSLGKRKSAIFGRKLSPPKYKPTKTPFDRRSAVESQTPQRLSRKRLFVPEITGGLRKLRLTQPENRRRPRIEQKIGQEIGGSHESFAL
jgi:hypothetical protein